MTTAVARPRRGRAKKATDPWTAHLNLSSIDKRDFELSTALASRYTVIPSQTHGTAMGFTTDTSLPSSLYEKASMDAHPPSKAFKAPGNDQVLAVSFLAENFAYQILGRLFLSKIVSLERSGSFM